MRRAALLLCLCLTAVSCSHRVAATAPALASGPVVLPAGTVLAIIAAETIDSTQPSANRAYAAVISRDTKYQDPQTYLPSGSPATLVLIAKEAGGLPSWQLGISSVTLNGDSFLVEQGGKPGALIGTFLGGVPGPQYPELVQRQPGAPTGLVVSETTMHIVPGSLLTFRLQQGITLTGSVH